MTNRSWAARLRRSAALGALLSAAGGLAFAQEPPTPGVIATVTPPEEEKTESEKVTITGTRIQQDSYNSTSPMTLVTAEEADAQGVNDIATLLQASVAAAGSGQTTSAISSAFVTPGGLGTQTIGLRGLGAQRTLVLLNGRRAGPAGTGGSVGAFDLNVIPLSAVERVDILKDGASALYGSDAIAGVVNIITKTDTGGSIDFSFTRPEVSEAGQEFQISGTYGLDLGNGYIRVTGIISNRRNSTVAIAASSTAPRTTSSSWTARAQTMSIRGPESISAPPTPSGATTGSTTTPGQPLRSARGARRSASTSTTTSAIWASMCLRSAPNPFLIRRA